jgi:putative aldouronate transport system substrate-binding protein
MEYLEKNHKLLVAPGASYITPDEPSTISTIRGQVKTEIVADSWKASVAKSHAELVQILDNMRQKVDGLNYKAVLDFDMKCAKDQNAARIAIKNQYK